MQFGFSSYSFFQHLRSGKMSILDVIDWVADSEGTHLELALGFVNLKASGDKEEPNLDQNPELVGALKKRAADRGVVLSNIAASADFLGDADSVRRNVETTKRLVDVAAELGITLFRHDVSQWAYRAKDVAEFDAALPGIVECSKEIAQHAAQYGITTSVENHGYLMNGSERVRRLLYQVDEPNFKTTLDIGNFLCVDENPTVAVKNNLPYASIVHLKDFYIRDHFPGDLPGEGWLHTPGGAYLLGAIVGYGDLEMHSIVKQIKDSGYDGFITIEFEGIEECLLASATGLANAKRLFAEV